MTVQKRAGRDFIARHGETIFNAAARFQEGQPHVPLTRTGFLQADEMGKALREELGAKPELTIWCSTAERAVQTMAIIAGWLELDPFDAKLDPRLVEISTGSFGGRYYKDVVAELGPVTLADGVLKTPADGETYEQVAARCRDWLAATADDAGTRIVISHGNTARVLRGIMAGLPDHPLAHVPFAPVLPQGSISLIEGGVDSVAHLGGASPADMKRIALPLALLAAPVAARDPIGTFGRWGAFRDPSPRHCFAISEPVQTVRGGTQRGFVSVARWPSAGVRAQLHVRLTRPRHPQAAVTLSVGERRFTLEAGPSDAWAPDDATDRAIIAAMRSGRSLSVESLSASRRPFVDAYALHGAATAIDAATLACTR